MVTLKDIKISRTRIPLQNAIWIRPTNGLKFKIYYPHGGDWAEISIDASSSESDEEKLTQLSEKVKALEDTISGIDFSDLQNIQKVLSGLVKTINRANTRIDSVNTAIDNIRTSINRLYDSVDFTNLTLTQKLPLGINQISLTDYGIDDYYYWAFLNNTAKRVTIPGYETSFTPTNIDYTPSAYGLEPAIITELSLLETTKYILFRLIAYPQHPVGRTPFFNYTVDGTEFRITEDTVILDKILPAETKSNVTLEYLESYGFTTEMFQMLNDSNEHLLIFKDTPTPYFWSGEMDDSYIGFYIHWYDRITMVTKQYEVTFTLVGNAWSGNVIYTELTGDVWQQENWIDMFII